MKPLTCVKGVTLIEMVMAMAISVMAMLLLWRGVLFLQMMLSQQMRLERMSQVLILTQEMTQTVRAARRVISVGPNHLDLEVYNHSSYGLLDPHLYEKTKRVRYQFNSEEQTNSMVREIYASTEAAKPEHSHIFLKNVDLMVPTVTEPFFFPSYLVGMSTIGVRVELGLHPPFSKERWAPIKDEVYVQAE